ncbi:hypothetical protein OPT61_g8988 [Boeremia exigua]|uniref:Uncharacterized protein n=1 Tax=Boeremia exigua TaxID=749465 RepID=A0ACC2HXM7_9PLEO|nr:hypothetical protein OPT61_g8988 [Boeremia exigua]
MHLTRSTDRLVAIAGIASLFEENFGSRATFGLWIELLNEELLWTTNPFTRSATHGWNAPSWSWANLENCSIVPSKALLPGETHDLGFDRCLEVTAAPIIRMPPHIGFPNLPPVDVESGFLCLQGKLVPCGLQKGPYGIFLRQQSTSKSALHNDRIGYFKSDVQLTVEEEDADYYYCLLIRSELHYISGWNEYHQMKYFGLVLVPVQKVANYPLQQSAERYFVRMGIHSEYRKSSEDDEFRHDPDLADQQRDQYFWTFAGEDQDVTIV